MVSWALRFSDSTNGHPASKSNRNEFGTFPGHLKSGNWPKTSDFAAPNHTDRVEPRI